MNKTSFWNEDKTSGALWGAGLVAAALLIGGSFWPGWQLNSTAAKMANERAETAVVKVLAPICADNFLRSASTEQMAAYAAKQNYNRGDDIAKVVKLDGKEISDYSLKSACDGEVQKRLEADKAKQAQKN